jgi:hypothetical protein
MPITPSTGAAPETVAPPKRSRTAPKVAATPPTEAAEAPAAEQPSGGIRRTGGIQRVSDNRPGRAPAPTPQRDLNASIDDWAHTGDEAAQKSAEEVARKEAEKAANIRWPRHFRLNLTPPKNQADVIILDAKPGPRIYMHTMRGPYDDWPNTPEPCPREFEICPICPPNGEHHSAFTMILSVINMSGYTKNTGQVVGATKELLLPRTELHPFFDELYKEHGSLRGIQLLMKRETRFDPYIGKPTFVGKHTDEEIEAFLRQENLWGEVLKEGSDEVLFPEGSMAQAFVYNEFVKKPSAADLIVRYGGQPTPGSDLANSRGGGDGQFGGGRYAPRPMRPGGQNTNFGGFGGGQPGGTDLDDAVPF